jgi:hypothetical protein
MVGAGLGIALGTLSQPQPLGIIRRPLAAPDAGHRIMLATVAGRPAADAFVKLARARSWTPAGTGLAA